MPADATLESHLRRIRDYLHHLGLETFPARPSPLRTRLADFMERHLEEAAATWLETVTHALAIEGSPKPVGDDMRAATIRWIHHVREPQDVETYEVLQRHARLGFIAHHPPARFLASQLVMREKYRGILRRELAGDAELGDLLSLLEQEAWERTLHITDFFVEAREQDLAEQSESYRRSVDSAPTPILLCDAESGTILNLNRVATREVGTTPAGGPVWDLHPEEERSIVRRLFGETIEAGTGKRENLHLARPDGEPLPVDMRTALIEIRQQSTIQVIYVDLSERRQLEFQLIQAEKMAGIGQLAAGIAHEIRNPLGIINNALYDLGELLPDASPEVREDLQIARAEMQRVQEIISNLLEFSHDNKTEEQPVDLDDLVARTLKLMDKYLQNSGVRAQVDLGATAPCIANENGIRQVLLNLITNAVQAMPEGGELRIETRPMGDTWLRLVVEDDGEGIPPERRRRIFEPFFTTKEPGRGTGLGLSIVHSVIKRARGRIEVANRPGRGTRFIIQLPITGATPAASDDTGDSAR